MREDGAITARTTWERREQFQQAVAEVYRQTQNSAELDDDGKHLPVAVAEANMQQRFRDAQVGGGADW